MIPYKVEDVGDQIIKQPHLDITGLYLEKIQVRLLFVFLIHDILF